MTALKDRVAIVTGASSGIGAAIAEALAAEGAQVALAARRVERLHDLKERIEQDGGRVLVVPTDVTNREQVRALVAQAEDELGPVDIMVANAGVMPLSYMHNLHEDEWERMVDVNIKGVLNSIGAVLEGMLDRGHGDIVAISSDAGRKVFPGGAVYCGTKWAVEAILQGLRLEIAGSGVRVTSIQPGSTDTELASAITDEEILAQSKSREGMTALRADDVARAVVYALRQPAYAAINEVLLRPSQQGQ